MTKVIDKYFSVVTSEGSDSADLLLYGVIGQDYWWRDNQEDSITDMEVIKAIRRLEKQYSRINIRINSPGGSIYHGNAIINAMRSSSAEIHTYNDGLAASMASSIWLASEHRHMATNALLMVHAPSSYVFGNAGEMQEAITVLEKFESTLVTIIAEATGISAEKIKAEFFDYKDHWMNAEDCAARGFIEAPEEFESEEVIEGASAKSLLDLITAFAKKGDQLARAMLETPNQKINAIKAGFASLVNSNNQTFIAMQKQDLQKSFQDGTLSPEDLTALLTEAGYEIKAPEVEPPAAPAAAATPEPEPQPDLTATITATIAAATKPLTDQIAALEAKVATYGKLPGASRTDSHANEDNHEELSPEQIALQKQHKAAALEMDQAAKGPGNPYQGLVE